MTNLKTFSIQGKVLSLSSVEDLTAAEEKLGTLQQELQKDSQNEKLKADVKKTTEEIEKIKKEIEPTEAIVNDLKAVEGLEKIVISGNTFRPGACKALAEALTANQTLKARRICVVCM